MTCEHHWVQERKGWQQQKSNNKQSFGGQTLACPSYFLLPNCKHRIDIMHSIEIVIYTNSGKGGEASFVEVLDSSPNLLYYYLKKFNCKVEYNTRKHETLQSTIKKMHRLLDWYFKYLHSDMNFRYLNFLIKKKLVNASISKAVKKNKPLKNFELFPLYRLTNIEVFHCKLYKIDIANIRRTSIEIVKETKRLSNNDSSSLHIIVMHIIVIYR